MPFTQKTRTFDGLRGPDILQSVRSLYYQIAPMKWDAAAYWRRIAAHSRRGTFICAPPRRHFPDSSLTPVVSPVVLNKRRTKSDLKPRKRLTDTSAYLKSSSALLENFLLDVGNRFYTSLLLSPRTRRVKKVTGSLQPHFHMLPPALTGC